MLTGQTVYRKKRRIAAGRRHAGGRRPDDDPGGELRAPHHRPAARRDAADGIALSAQALGVAGERGALKPGLRADLVHLSDDLAVNQTIIGGRTAWSKSA